MSKQVILTIPDSVDLSALREMKVILHYYKDGNDLYEYSTDMISLSEENGDLISRNELRSALGKQISCRGGYICVRDIMNLINNAPAVELERPKGKWVYLPTDGKYKCPKCDNTCKCDTFPIFRYCPWCGSDNLGDDE